LTTRVVNVRNYKPYSSYWYNQPSNSQYVYIGRAVRRGPVQNHIPINSKWHNPYPIPKEDRNNMAKRLEVIRQHKEYLLNSGLLSQVHELKDKVLGCWCKPLPCHGDTLAELANRLTD
jgi:hypothetical protein